MTLLGYLCLEKMLIKKVYCFNLFINMRPVKFTATAGGSIRKIEKICFFYYSVFNNPCPIFIEHYLYENGQDFLDIQSSWNGLSIITGISFLFYSTNPDPHDGWSLVPESGPL